MKITSIVFTYDEDYAVATINFDNEKCMKIEIDTYVGCCETFGIDVTDGLLSLCKGEIRTYRGDRGHRMDSLEIEGDIEIPRGESSRKGDSSGASLYHQIDTFDLPILTPTPMEFDNYRIISGAIYFSNKGKDVGIVYGHNHSDCYQKDVDITDVEGVTHEFKL